MNKKEQTALNMAGFIRSQTLLLLEKLNKLDLDQHSDECELAEQLHLKMKMKGNLEKNRLNSN